MEAERGSKEQATAYERFRALHEAPGIFVMPNPWDGASALLLRNAGFQALGSSSLALAASLACRDGAGALSRRESVEAAAFLARISGLPVNGDLEDGFGPEPEDCARTVEVSIGAGLAGLGIEDTTARPEHPIHDFDVAVRRVHAAAEAASGRILLTARTDNFLQGRPELDDTIRRLTAFAEAGADVLYAPGLPNIEAIEAVVRAVAPKPVNVVVGPADGVVPLERLLAAGVKRVSLGGALYRHMMHELAQAAARLAKGDLGWTARQMPSMELQAMFND